MAYRYAIYYSPPTASPLGAFGAKWLGRTIEGQDLAPPALAWVSAQDWKTATVAPRKYGFHATLKPPFRLADGASEDELVSAVESFCAETGPADLGSLKVDRISGFLALTPERQDAVGRLAADIVREFDRFRAPLTAEEIERRRPETLTPRQRQLLDCWGYPYVIGDFRFHMTLTGNLPEADRAVFCAELEDRFSDLKTGPMTIDGICVFQQKSPEDELSLLRRIKLRET